MTTQGSNGITLRKLGKLPAKHDTRTLRLAKYLPRDLTLSPAPASVDWSLAVERGGGWGMMANDAIGDCTCAAAGHMIESWVRNDGEGEPGWYPATPDIVTAYREISGYDPARPETDQGAVELDVLNFWRTQGIAGRRILAFAALDPLNVEQIKQAVWRFGGCYIGLALPMSAADQDVWEIGADGLHGDGAPGSWGGHAVNVVGYDEQGLTCVTWGRTQKMTWEFWQAYCDEAYAVLSTDETGADGKAPNGFDLAALQRDLAEVGRMDAFDPSPTPAPAPPVPPVPVSDKPLLIIPIFAGLGTDPAGDCCGMRPLAEAIAAAHPEYETQILAFGWDQKPPAATEMTFVIRADGGVPLDELRISAMLQHFNRRGLMDAILPVRHSIAFAGTAGGYSNSPDGLCRWIKDTIVGLAAEARSRKRDVRIVGLRHSFGGALGMFFDQWLADWYSGPAKNVPPFVFDQVIDFDPVPNGVRFGRGQGKGWRHPKAVAPHVLCFYQTAGKLAFIKGEPTADAWTEQAEEPEGAVDVTLLRNPELYHTEFMGHVGMINDLRMQRVVLTTVRGRLATNAQHEDAKNVKTHEVAAEVTA